MKRLVVTVLAVTILLSFKFNTVAFADELVDIGSSKVQKNLSNFVSTMYYEPRDRVNNVTFYYNGYRLSSIKDYTMEYKNNKMPGTATVTYTGVGKYTGTYKKTFTIKKMPLSKITTKAHFDNKKKLIVTANNGSEHLVVGKDFKYFAYFSFHGNVTVNYYGIGDKYTGTAKVIIDKKDNPYKAPADYLKKVKIKKCKTKGKKLTIKWKKLKKVTGYQIKYWKANSKAKKKNVPGSQKSYTVKKIKKGKTYYVKMRCYIAIGKKKHYGKWSSAVMAK